MLIVVDVGNSGAKAGAFDAGRLHRARRLCSADVETPEELAASLDVPPGRADAVVVVSVCERGLSEFLSGPGRGALVLGRDLPILVGNRYLDPAQVGLDRLVNCAAAHELSGGAAIAVDLGSAVTVDAVDGEGAFLGGAIGPGLPALAAGLRAAAPALPGWGGEPPAPALPRSTGEAVGWGTVLGLAGMVDRLVAEVRREVGEHTPVYLTGGDATLVSGRLACRTEVFPHLTLDGIRILYDRARRI
jgi:type III pantothenate kinase